jgi:hypothetical protein
VTWVYTCICDVFIDHSCHVIKWMLTINMTSIHIIYLFILSGIIPFVFQWTYVKVITVQRVVCTSLDFYVFNDFPIILTYLISVSQMTTVCSICRNTSRSFPRSWLITGATSGAVTGYPSGAPEFTSDFYWGSFYSIFSFMCMCCRSLFVLLSFFYLPLCSLDLSFDLRILITPFVSSNSCNG